MSGRRLSARIIAVAIALLVASVAFANTVELTEWLVAGPVTIPYADADAGLDVDPVEQLIENVPVDPFEFWPAEGDPVMLGVGKTVTFSASNGMLPVEDANGVRFALLAGYLSSPAWQEGKLNIVTQSPFALFVDGESATSSASYKDEADTTSHDVILDQGHHRVLLAVALADTQEVGSWAINVSYEQNEGTPAEWLPFPTLDPVHAYDLIDYYRSDNVSSIRLSPNGQYLALDLSKRSRKDDKSTDRLEVWDTKTGKLLWTYEAEKGVGNLAWAPDNNRLLFKSGAKLYLWNRYTNSVERVEAELDGGSFRWAPDGLGVYYIRTIQIEDEEDKNYQVMWGMRDRWNYWREEYALHYFAFENGLDVALLKMKYQPESWSISRDGRHIAFARTLPEAERPFEIMDLLLFDVQTGESRSVFQGRFQRDEYAHIVISSDGMWIAFAAPIQEVSGNDTMVPDVNSSHHALWVVNVQTGEVRRVDPSFDKSIDFFYYRTGYNNDFIWHADGYVAFTAAYEGKIWYCTWTPGTDKIDSQLLSTPGFSYLSLSTEKGAKVAAYQGDTLDDFPDIHVMDLKKNRGGVFLKLNEDLRRLTRPTQRVEPWNYTNSDGVLIYGYLYYPYDYDPSKSYPLIVDTYGGVIGFGDSWQWSSEVFANRGYFVYVPSPRGAAGFGQAYADTHVNDWGTLTSRDMNEGVRNIVENVPAVDGARCGFVSGSYGGFLAMYLLTIPEDHPDYYPYVTTISDYGISNLASYWGIGWWGAFYSEKASAGSFPWNKTDWYVSQSPLFQADEITEPLLLLHGLGDTNVPPGESEQMYTALKVLNRDVVYIRYPGENHGIASTRTKYLETKQMHIEWFDKYLRDRPGAWEKRMENEYQK